MDFDQRSKHNAIFHQDLLKKRKRSICDMRWLVHQKSPFIAARKIQKLAETETYNVPVPPKQTETDGPPVAKKPTLETHVMAASIIDVNVKCNTSDYEWLVVHTRRDEVAVEGVIELPSDKCKSFGEDVEYEFRKEHRPLLPPARFDENRECSYSPNFSQ